MSNFWSRQWKPRKEKVEFLPVEIAFVVSAVQASLPATHYLIEKLSKTLNVSRNAIVAIMPSHLCTKLLPLLTNRSVPIPATPLVNSLDTVSQPRLHCLTFHRPVTLLGFTPIMSETKQVKRFRSLSTLTSIVRLLFTTAFIVGRRPEIKQFRLIRMQRETILLESLRDDVHHSISIILQLKYDNKIISKSNKTTFTSHQWLDLFLKPFIQNIV